MQALATRKYQFELSDPELDRHWGVAYAELFQRLFGAVEPDLGRAIAAYEALDAEFEMSAYPETQRVLEALLPRCLVGVVTAAGRSLVQAQMRKLGFPVAAFTLLQTAEDTPHHKPDPRVFEPALRILEKHAISASDTLYVGDSIRDFHAARDAGLAFIGVLRGTTSQQEFAEAGVTTIESLDALLDQ